jgi:hypothetical protein
VSGDCVTIYHRLNRKETLTLNRQLWEYGKFCCGLRSLSFALLGCQSFFKCILIVVDAPERSQCSRGSCQSRHLSRLFNVVCCCRLLEQRQQKSLLNKSARWGNSLSPRDRPPHIHPANILNQQGCHVVLSCF